MENQAGWAKPLSEAQLGDAICNPDMLEWSALMVDAESVDLSAIDKFVVKRDGTRLGHVPTFLVAAIAHVVKVCGRGRGTFVILPQGDGRVARAARILASLPWVVISRREMSTGSEGPVLACRVLLAEYEGGAGVWLDFTVRFQEPLGTQPGLLYELHELTSVDRTSVPGWVDRVWARRNSDGS